MAFLRHFASISRPTSSVRLPLTRCQCFRPLSSTTKLLSKDSSSSSPFLSPQPSPPKLDKEEQAIFEELQRRSTGAFSTPRPDPSEVQASTGKDLKIDERTGDVLHPDTPRKAAPEFEGDVNPKTGEVGGPKNEPLRWGAEGDWSFNGRATDF